MTMEDELNAKSLFDLSGRTVIVTGGAVGIGKVYSRALGEVGANVVIADITDNEGGALAGEINESGGNAVYVSTDVSDMAACTALATFASTSRLSSSAMPMRRPLTPRPRASR